MRIESEGKLKASIYLKLKVNSTNDNIEKSKNCVKNVLQLFVNNFDLPCWQKIPLKSTLPQSQRGPLSVAIHFPPFWHGLFEAQASEALDLTP